MKNSIIVLLCTLILVACSKGTFLAESVPMDMTELSGKVAERERLPLYTPLPIILDSLAFVMHYNNSSPNSQGIRIGNAVVVTEIHAITPVTSIKEHLPNTFESLKLKVGVFINEERGTEHNIKHIEPHPEFEYHENYSYADIAVIFLNDAINFPMENVFVAPLCLEDLESDKYMRQCHLTECGVDDSKAFHSIITSDKPWLLKTNPAIIFWQNGDSAAAFWRNQLAGIAPSYSHTGPFYIFFTKIFNFLPFIIDQLIKDTVEGRNPPYNFHSWINVTELPENIRCKFNTVS